MIEKTDERIGRILTAVDQRPHRRDEDWLILVGTDHGGRGTGHGGNRNVAEVCQVPLIVSGPSAAKALPSRRIETVDLAACAVAHLGIEASAAWELDGSADGLLNSREAAR
jgi:arylsulfatase A-like enzyme